MAERKSFSGNSRAHRRIGVLRSRCAGRPRLFGGSPDAVSEASRGRGGAAARPHRRGGTRTRARRCAVSMIEFRMPSLGADMDAGTLVEWLKKPGDPVARGDIIAVVDTEKGAIEIE